MAVMDRRLNHHSSASRWPHLWGTALSEGLLRLVLSTTDVCTIYPGKAAQVLEHCSHKKTGYTQDFPGCPAIKTPCSQCRGHRFHPWSGN